MNMAIGGANGGKTYAFNNITAANNVIVAPLQPNRRKITFVNPGQVTLYVSMTIQIDPIMGTQFALTPTTALLGGTLPVYPGAFVVVEGECQQQWQALAASGTNNPLTVLDSFV